MTIPLSSAPQLALVRAKLESLGYTTVEGAREAARLVPGEAAAFLGHSLPALLASLPQPVGWPPVVPRFPLGVNLAAIPMHLTAFRHFAGLLPAPPANATNIALMGPIRNQKHRSTCVGFSSCAVREAYEAQKNGGASPVLSPQYVYFECKQKDGEPSIPGTYLKVAFESLKDDGVCRDSEWPYPGDPQTPEGGGPKPMVADADAELHKVLKFAALPPTSILEIKAQIARGNCVAVSFQAFLSWVGSAVTLSTGAITLPFPHEQALPSGHAVCVVGYRTDASAPGGGVFVIRNSWGPAWGKNSPDGSGYGTLPFAYLTAYGKEAYCIEE
jgi:hypothetical protein